MKKILIFLMAIVSMATYSEEKVITLDDAIKRAIENNIQIKITDQEKESAKGKVIQAKAAYYPKLKLNGGITHFSESPDLLKLTNKLVDLNNGVNAMADISLAEYALLKNYYTQLEAATPGKYTQMVGAYTQLEQNQATLAGMLQQKERYSTNLNYFGIKLALEQPIYTGKKITSLNKQAEENQKLSEINSEILKNSIRYEVKKAYYTVLQAEKMYSTAKEGATAIEEHYKEAEAYFKAGIVTKIDVSRADAKRSEIKQKVIAAENGVRLAKAALLFTMGSEIEEEFKVEEREEYSEIKYTNEEYLKSAMEERKELKQIDSKIKMAEYSVAIAKSDKLPLIAVTGEIGEVTNAPFQKNSDGIEWQVSLVGSWNIFDGGTVTGKVAESKSILSQAEKGKELIKKGIEIEVKQAYLNVKSAYESIESAKKSITQWEESVKLAEEGYKAGLSSSLEVIDSQMALIQAKNSYIMAVGQYNISKAQLEKAVGNDK